jgi:hypothetical protein
MQFTDKKEIKFSQLKDGIVLQLQEVPRDIDFVVEMILK